MIGPADLESQPIETVGLRDDGSTMKQSECQVTSMGTASAWIRPNFKLAVN